MPLLIDEQTFLKATGLTPAYARRRLRGVKRVGASYCVASLLSTITPFRKYASAIVQAAQDDNELIVSNDENLIDALQMRILNEPDMSYRFYRCKTAFVVSLVSTRGSTLYMPFLNSLRGKLLLNGPTLRYVITGEDAVPNQSKSFASAFALVNAAWVDSMTPLEFKSAMAA